MKYIESGFTSNVQVRIDFKVKAIFKAKGFELIFDAVFKHLNLKMLFINPRIPKKCELSFYELINRSETLRLVYIYIFDAASQLDMIRYNKYVKQWIVEIAKEDEDYDKISQVINEIRYERSDNSIFMAGSYLMKSDQNNMFIINPVPDFALNEAAYW